MTWAVSSSSLMVREPMGLAAVTSWVQMDGDRGACQMQGFHLPGSRHHPSHVHWCHVLHAPKILGAPIHRGEWDSVEVSSRSLKLCNLACTSWVSIMQPVEDDKCSCNRQKRLIPPGMAGTMLCREPT
eukprot:3066064-Ditylum_brightwellii.AAC.2